MFVHFGRWGNKAIPPHAVAGGRGSGRQYETVASDEYPGPRYMLQDLGCACPPHITHLNPCIIRFCMVFLCFVSGHGFQATDAQVRRLILHHSNTGMRTSRGVAVVFLPQASPRQRPRSVPSCLGGNASALGLSEGQLRPDVIANDWVQMPGKILC